MPDAFSLFFDCGAKLLNVPQIWWRPPKVRVFIMQPFGWLGFGIGLG